MLLEVPRLSMPPPAPARSSRPLVRPQDERQSFPHVLFGSHREFQVAGGPVTNFTHVANKPGIGDHLTGIELQVDHERVLLHHNAAEIFDTTEGHVELELLLCHIVAQSEGESPKLLEEV